MTTSTLDINKFASLKTTKGTYNKILGIAQEIHLKRAKQLTAGQEMSPYTEEENDVITLCDFVSLAIKSPTFCRSSMADLVRKSKDPVFRSKG